MKTTRYLFITALFALMGMSAKAQQRNVLQVPDVTSQTGNVQLPVNIENTDEIVGVQFDLTLPAGVTAEAKGVMSGRSDGHSVTVSRLSNGAYRVLLHSDKNLPLRGQQGVVMYLPIAIPASFTEGSEHQMAVANAVLGKASGENVLTEALAGKIRISKLPDLRVKNITFDKQTLNPGERIVASWQVENIGEMPTGGGWSEQLSFVSEDGKQSKYITTAHYDGTLDAGGIVSRQVEVTLPSLMGIDGKTKLQVKIVPDSNAGESASAQGNNTQLSNSLLFINKVLTLDLSPHRTEENSGRSIALKVNRSGSWMTAETFAITATADSRVSVPENITIPENQSGTVVYFNVTDNTVLDNDSIVNIKVTGNSYPEVSAKFIIEDNEYPNLTLTASKSEVTEGETFQLTVKASRASATPIEVTLTSENNKRFSYPNTVTIPAGETSAQVTVQAIDDELPSLDLTNAFTASAPKYNKGEVLVILKDDDLPVLELTLTPATVSESAGVVAVAGVLKRTTNTNNKIIVKLSDDANGGLYFGNRTLELAKGVEEVHFNFGPVDNALVDGDRTYTITAAVWLSSCSCSASGESAGSVIAQLQVLDNDGAALKLTSSQSTVKEGGNTMLTVSRNTTDNSAPLTVTLQSDYDDNLTYNHTVTIPADQTSATVEVVSKSNDVQGDNHTVVFTAQAEGYATGTCYLMVTDQTLPDARINSITADVAEAEVGTKAILNIVVTNDGAAELPAEVPVMIYCRGDANAVGYVYTSEAIPVEGSQTLTKTITLPTSVGMHNYYAVVNESNKIQELTYNNNTSEDVAISTLAPFSVAVSTDKSIYKQGEKIIITGQLTGNGTANTSVELYVINEGARQMQSVTTDAQGAFTYEWQLYAQQSGHFSVGACYPGEGLKKEMASFDVYGLRRSSNNYITCEVGLGDTATGQVGFYNAGNLALTGVKAEIISVPNNCEASVQMPSSISGGSIAQMTYSLKGTEVSTQLEWSEVKVRITANEGVTCDATLYFYCYSQIAQLSVDVMRIDATITKGSTREFPLQIVNIGKGASGEIRLALPEWMSCLSGTILPSMEFNDTTTIVLLMNTNDRMQLNVPVTGTIGINCANGNGLTINYKVEPVSEEKGILKVDACDEYTYSTDEAPHVSGAQVVIKHPYTEAEIARGTTNADGTFEIELPAGYYKVEVSADKHNRYSNYCNINPGKTEYLVANISYQAITVSWSVEETEIEDEYEIVTTVHYETNVPMPVVKIDIPKSIDGDNMAVGDAIVINMVLTNVGLIRADNVETLLPQNMTEWEFVPLGMTEKFTLNPQQTVVVPIQITRIADESTMSMNTRKKNPADNYHNCMAGLAARYEWLCGDDIKNNEAAERMAMKLCAASATLQVIGDALGGIFGGGGPSGPGGSGGSGGSGGGSTVYNEVTKTMDICDPCDAARMEAGINAALSFTWLGPINDALTDATEAAQIERRTGKYPGKTWYIKKIGGKIFDAVTGVALDIKLFEGASDFWSLGDGIYAVVTACDDSEQKSNNNVRRKASTHSWVNEFDETALRFIDQLRVMESLMLYTFGDSIWCKEPDEQKADFIRYVCGLPDDVIPTDEDLLAHKPESVTLSQMRSFVNHVYGIGSTTPSAEAIEEKLSVFSQMNDAAKERGYSSMTEEFTTAYSTYRKHYEEMASSSVCASITLQFKQTMTMTRQAFRGKLIVFNGHESLPMTDVKLSLNVFNSRGQVATSHEFEIHTEADGLKGFEGEARLPGGWTLGAQQEGTASILFIPTKYAAPTEPVEWSFGGTLSYIDPFTGLEVTHDLYPVTLTVKPSPELDLTYFMQRDVYGDDPLTEEVEPMVPAEFSLLINNIGNGDATNVKIVTQQPEIIENEKGLLIGFEILGAQLNGGDKALALGGSVATDFGNIPAHSQAYAQWWFQSSLLGHFTDYDVHATHVTSYGNPDLTLLNEVTIHELIRSIKVDDGKVTGFVVNDLVDAEDTPDMVYFTDGTTAEVAVAANATWQKQSNTEYLLTITPSQAGWNYGHVTDPTFGRAKLIGIRRQSDGKEINLRNFWQTDRTLRDGKEWLYENKLHFVDQMANSTETYLLTFEPRPNVELQVASFDGIPEENVVLHEPLQSVTVTFNKAIDASTFTAEDITLRCQGKAVEGSIGITPVSDTQFTLDLSQLTARNGYYVLTVQTANITDFEGFNGAAGKTATWIQFTETTTLALSFHEAEVTYGDNFTEPTPQTNNELAILSYSSSNPLVADVDNETGRVTINAVGTTKVNVSIEETAVSNAAQTSYRLTVLQPEGSSDAPLGIETVSITIPDGEKMTTFCSPWPIDFSGATNDCRAYMATTYHDDIVTCKEVTEAKGGAGLLIVGKPGTYTFPVRTCFNDPEENLFVGTLAPTYIEENSDYLTNLGLKVNKFVPLETGVIKANTAYLPIELDDNVYFMNIALESLTGLNIVTEQTVDATWYNISGQKVNGKLLNGRLPKGIYIQNGRKVVVK